MIIDKKVKTPQGREPRVVFENEVAQHFWEVDYVNLHETLIAFYDFYAVSVGTLSIDGHICVTRRGRVFGSVAEPNERAWEEAEQRALEHLRFLEAAAHDVDLFNCAICWFWWICPLPNAKEFRAMMRSR